jgi:hypothetical protein
MRAAAGFVYGPRSGSPYLAFGLRMCGVSSIGVCLRTNIVCAWIIVEKQLSRADVRACRLPSEQFRSVSVGHPDGEA